MRVRCTDTEFIEVVEGKDMRYGIWDILTGPNYVSSSSYFLGMYTGQSN